MRAAIMTRFGPPSVLEVADVPKPKPKPGEVLIRVEAAGLNRLDHYVREGTVLPEMRFPHVLGSDVVGTVEALGDGVSGFAIGDRVVPMPGYPTSPDDDGGPVLSASPSYAIRGLVEDGGYAEYMTAPARWTLKEETGLPGAEVAALPMPLVTGVRAVKVVGEVKAGQRVLIHAGASGTGSIMIQIAKALGAEVAATIRTDVKRSFVEGLGADLVVDMNDDDWPDAVRGWSEGGPDVVVDNLGGPNLARSIDVARPLGIIVLMGNVLGLEATVPVRSVFFPQKQVRGSLMGGVEDLRWGFEQVKAGTIKPTLDGVFPLEEAVEAHERLAAGEAVGNIVFDLSLAS